MNSFKPGDWIRSTRYPRLRPIRIESIYESNTRPGILGLKSKGTVFYSDEVELWQPKVGEWCWYKNLLVKVISINNRDDGIISYSVSNPMLGELYSGAITLEPFIGQLPTFIKDNT